MIGELTEGERLRLSAALMHQARLEATVALPRDIQDKLYELDEKSLERFDSFMLDSETRQGFFQFFALLIMRGHLVIDSPLIIPKQA